MVENGASLANRFAGEAVYTKTMDKANLPVHDRAISCNFDDRECDTTVHK